MNQPDLNPTQNGAVYLILFSLIRFKKLKCPQTVYLSTRKPFPWTTGHRKQAIIQSAIVQINQSAWPCYQRQFSNWDQRKRTFSF